MVNALDGKLWFVDTIDADVIDNRHLFVKSVRWVGGATSAAGNALIIRDPVTNTTLWESTASGANYVEKDLEETSWPNGFEVPTIDVGNLYITLR